MKKYTFVHFLVLWFTKLTGIIPALIFYKPRLHYMNKSCSRRLPRPAILMSNHKSLLDFPLYLMLFPMRTMRFQMAEVLFNKSKIFAWFLHCIGGIYVNRDNLDMAFMGNTLEILDKGGTVGIFPEGRLPVNGKPWPFKPSIAYIAAHSNAAIIPVYTDGNYGLTKRVNVMIGEAIDVRDYIGNAEPDKETYAKLTEILEGKKNEMQAELERRLNKDGK